MTRDFASRHFVWPLIPILVFLATMVGTAHAATMVYRYDAPETELDTRYVYQWTVLRTALEKTVAKYGPFQMVPSAPMSERRQTLSLLKNTGELSVMYLGTRPELEADLTAVHIPVDRNLGGYGIFLVNRDDLPKFADIRAIEPLKNFSYGLGSGWIDVDILQANGFTVRTGPNYDGLFKMLAQRRFDVFLRAAVEIIDEQAARRQDLPTLEIEPRLILYYPMPMYFWFAKTPEGRALAARAEEGMWMMVQDGSYDRLFDQFQRPKIDALKLSTRRLFALKNPYFSAPVPPYDDKRLWFDPKAAR